MATRYLSLASMIQRFIVTFFRWWVGQLAGLIPDGLKLAYADASDAAILEISGEQFILLIRRDGFVTRGGEGILRDLPALLGSVADLPRLLLLRIPEGQALRKKLSLPSAARRDLKNVLGFEIDRETPFEQAEVYWNYTVVSQDKAQGKLDIDLAVVPRRAVDPTLEAARRAGFNPSALDLHSRSDGTTLIWMGPQKRGQWLQSQRKLMPLAMAAGGLALAAILVPFAAQQWHLIAAERAISAIEPQAREAASLRQISNRRVAAIAFLGRTHGANGSVLNILAAATRALPKDTFLTALSLHNGRVTMSGSSEAAAHLIGQLANVSAFREPVFDSPILSQDGDLEKFTISVTLNSASPL